MNLIERKYFTNKEIVDTLHKSIIIEITRKCHKYFKANNSMGCSQCFLHPLDQQTIDLSILDKIINLTKNHFYTIGLVGGEPFTEPEIIINVLEKCPNNLINIFTSGELYSKNFIVQLSKFHNAVLTISLHGNESHHNQLAGKESYGNVIKNISRFNELKIKWIRKAVAYSGNIDYILSNQFEHDSFEMGCQYIDVCRYYPIGLNANHSLCLTKEQILLLDKKLRYLTEHRLCIYPEAYGKKCKSLITIDILGNILPCPYITESKDSVYNIETEKEFLDKILNIKHIWESENNSSNYCKMQNIYY